MKVAIKQFFMPTLTRGLIIRGLLTACLSVVVFAYVCIPMRITGQSMEPAFHDQQFVFCWAPAYWFSSPKRFDSVFVKMTGKRVVLLKRVVALAGETIGFLNGQLMINGNRLNEPHVILQGDWNLPDRRVKNDCVYVVGDNRSVSMETHVFGQTSLKRILGKPLAW